jgi:2-polyprenyl-3-methyl-5-hydroxy-6-metoxy-1,4-benzoquinol methylase
MIKNKLYERYHSSPKIQKRIIDENNFTYRNILSLLNKNLPKKRSKILDIGCGVGTIDFYLAKKNYLITGIDISKQAIEIAKENAKLFKLRNTKFVVGDVNKLKFKSKFDMILCSEIIEHVEDDSKLLHDLSKHLSKKGVILLTTPLDSAPLYKTGLTKRFDERVGHLRRYNLEKLKKIVHNNNLRISKIYYQDGAFRNIFFVFKFPNQIVRVANRVSFFSNTLAYIDKLFLKLFGPTDICLIIKKV